MNAPRRLLLLAAILLQAPALRSADRNDLSLDGTWQVGETREATAAPAQFAHRAPVPGLVNLARPEFPDVDRFDSKEVNANRVRKGVLPESARVSGAGVSPQDRNYFWFRRTFRAPAKREVALLRIGKAQFGTAVWVNDHPLGEYPGCFTASVFDATAAIRWNTENTVLVRLGAHPGALPDTYPAGTDFEKLKWTPGIYDHVTVAFCDNPVIEWTQVAPRLDPRGIVVQTQLKNHGTAPVTTLVTHAVRPWKTATRVAEAGAAPVTLAAGEERVMTTAIPLPEARLWSPEDPFLYEVATRTAGDSRVTRFGLREFRGDAATRRFLLNGAPYYLRGSNITLHRFFEDPLCGNLPWDERWLHRLLVEIPKQMNWNAFRFCIGPVPDRWLELADEAGLLIQNEFFIWTGAPSWDANYSRSYDLPEMIRQYGDWMRDNWNHPSIAIWDANNETLEPLFGEKIIPTVRPLDLSNRPWENSYNPPAGPDDPVEYHPYLFQPSASSGELKFRLSELETLDPTPRVWHYPRNDRPVLINEYGWLWLNRDGTPTTLTDKLYPLLLGPDATAAQRFAFNAYALAAKTEFWRTSRQYAGVLHFVYLTGSFPGVYTADHWRDVRRLELEPQFADYVGEAFKPLGVFVGFLQPTLRAGETREFPVKLVNDAAQPVTGWLELTLTGANGQVLARTDRAFDLAARGDGVLRLSLHLPDVTGPCTLTAAASARGSRVAPTRSRRWVTLE